MIMSVSAPAAEHWHAGWNTPGALPETPYGRFISAEDAITYLTDVLVDTDACDCDTPDCPDCTLLNDYCPPHYDYTCDTHITIAVLNGALHDGDIHSGYAVFNEANGLVYCVIVCTEQHADETTPPPAEPLTPRERQLAGLDEVRNGRAFWHKTLTDRHGDPAACVVTVVTASAHGTLVRYRVHVTDTSLGQSDTAERAAFLREVVGHWMN